MHASRLTEIDGCDASRNILSTGISFFAPGLLLGNDGLSKSAFFACVQKWASGSGLFSLVGISEARRSKTIFLLLFPLSPCDITDIPSEGILTQEAAKTLSPSISTIHALQFPSALYPGASFQQRCGIVTPYLLATCQMVSPLVASTRLPSKVKNIFSLIVGLSRLIIKTPLENI